MSRSPRAVEWIPARIDGRAGHRLMAILAAPGCTWERETGGCTNCSFPRVFGTGAPVSAEEFDAQLEEAIAGVPVGDVEPVQVELFVSGSFFNPEEVPDEARRRLLSRARLVPGVRRILVETRPEYVEPERIEAARDAADGVPLQVAIGLESADSRILRDRIRKGFGWRQFSEAARDLSAAGMELRVYLLLKPIDTEEGEAIEDAVASAKKVFDLGRSLGLAVEVALEPCFVGSGTVLEEAFLAGRYRPPWLWSVVEAVERIAPLGSMHVGLSDEGLDAAASAHNCEDCSSRVRAALGRFNETDDPAPLADLDCPCRSRWSGERGASWNRGRDGIPSRPPPESGGDETTNEGDPP